MSFAALFSLRLREPCPRGRRERLTAGVAIRKKYRHHQRRRRDLPSFLTLARMDTDHQRSQSVAPRMQSLKSKKDVIEEAWQTKKKPSHRRRHHRRHRGPPRHRLVPLRRAPPKDHS